MIAALHSTPFLYAGGVLLIIAFLLVCYQEYRDSDRNDHES